MSRLRILASIAAAALAILIVVNLTRAAQQKLQSQGRQIFRFDTFGDQDFWGGALQLHKAIEGTRFGGVGPGISPRTALALGLRVDVDALPQKLREELLHHQVNLGDPAVTFALLKLNAVVGLTG